LQLLDEAQFVSEDRRHFIGHPFGMTLGRTFPGEPFERRLRREAGHRRFFRILIGELVEREAAARGDVNRARQRLGIAAEKARHLFGRLQIAVGMTLAPEPGFVDGAIVPDAGDDILQDAPHWDMEDTSLVTTVGTPARAASFDSS
jgi:hypothetical protein